VARLIQLFLEHYPPETDPKHEGAFWVSDHDSAVMLRDQLISTLGSQSSIEALEALRELEVRFASRYPWLRRPRSAVERAYRQSLFHPIPPTTIANLLTDQSKRIIRSESDAIDGILAALELYERSLHHASPAGIEDLWDTPFGLPATPKKEERISDKICEAIRRYFSQYAVAADREVQLRRRNVATRLEGEPGSEVDVLVTIPAAVTLGSDPILIPIEVKRSCNPEAKTGLCEQLVERYMSEIGASAGVFVVAWLEAPSMETTKIPKWTDMETARSELTEQAAHITKESGGAICVKPFVLDATLR
jgi:hypothetical protein